MDESEFLLRMFLATDVKWEMFDKLSTHSKDSLDVINYISLIEEEFSIRLPASVHDFCMKEVLHIINGEA